MNIEDIVSDDYVEFPPDAPVSKLVGAFDDPSVEGVVVRGDEFEGVITRRQLATSRHPSDEKLRSLIRHVPRLDPRADVREVAQLMIDADSRLLPVFEGEALAGVVTAEAIVRAVRPFLDAATVEDASTADLLTVGPSATVGEALHSFRSHRITHLPVVEAGSPVGILSLYDVVDLAVRSTDRSQGGGADGTDAFGGGRGAGSGRSRGGGFGAREGERERLLDLPVRDVMTSPVRTIGPDRTLEAAADELLSFDGSSLVVEDDGSFGILTVTDLLGALTWEAGGERGVQLYGADLLDDVTYEEVRATIEGFDDRDAGATLLEAKVHLHEHDETRRGTPLLLARVRLYTDRGTFVASGEGFGARHALGEARDVLDRQLRDEKTRGRSKKHPDEAFWEKRFGWLLEE
jgi:CBS domain-containing protein